MHRITINLTQSKNCLDLLINQTLLIFLVMALTSCFFKSLLHCKDHYYSSCIGNLPYLCRIRCTPTPHCMFFDDTRDFHWDSLPLLHISTRAHNNVLPDDWCTETKSQIRDIHSTTSIHLGDGIASELQESSDKT